MNNRALLTAHHVSATANRLKVLACLQDGTHFHAIADISKHLPELNVKSIYNSIKVLVAAGLIDGYTFNGVVKYALSDEVLGFFNQVHMINAEQEVSHLTVPSDVFEEIKKVVNASGHELRAIKIFVDIK